mmetsp:Transcript_105475/g.227317  ORF Transcript_105475/g.227317 Transcript_105475/m.227317 type:complete len:347 (-) Transcript_105475:194-1234(-)
MGGHSCGQALLRDVLRRALEFHLPRLRQEADAEGLRGHHRARCGCRLEDRLPVDQLHPGVPRRRVYLEEQPRQDLPLQLLSPYAGRLRDHREDQLREGPGVDPHHLLPLPAHLGHRQRGDAHHQGEDGRAGGHQGGQGQGPAHQRVRRPSGPGQVQAGGRVWLRQGRRLEERGLHERRRQLWPPRHLWHRPAAARADRPCRFLRPLQAAGLPHGPRHRPAGAQVLEGHRQLDRDVRVPLQSRHPHEHCAGGLRPPPHAEVVGGVAACRLPRHGAHPAAGLRTRRPVGAEHAGGRRPHQRPDRGLLRRVPAADRPQGPRGQQTEGEGGRRPPRQEAAVRWCSRAQKG